MSGRADLYLLQGQFTLHVTDDGSGLYGCSLSFEVNGGLSGIELGCSAGSPGEAISGALADLAELLDLALSYGP